MRIIFVPIGISRSSSSSIARTIAKHARYRQEYKKTFVLPAISACVMGGAALGVYKVLTFILPAALLRGRSGRAIVVFPAVAVAAAVYAVLLHQLP